MDRKISSYVLVLLGVFVLGEPGFAQDAGQQMAEAAGRGLVGSVAPRFVLQTIDGQSIDLARLYGRKAVYLKFWATWCVPCREQMPHLERTFQAAGTDLAVIAINVGFDDPIEEIQRYRQKLGLTMPIVRDDGSLGAAFNLRVTPQHIVIGRDGRIQYVGHRADAQLDAALASAKDALPQGATASARIPAETAGITAGDPLPARSVVTLDGRHFALRQHDKPRPTVIMFLSPWCETYLATTRPAIAASCRSAREQVAMLSRDQRVRWLGIASGLWATPNDLREYQAEHRISIPLTLDESGSLFRTFRITDVPTFLIADAAGTVRQRLTADDPEQLRKAIAAL